MITKKQLYQRQTTLPEIGDVGQQRLQNAKVLVVGCGGLGSVAAVYLAGSGIGNLHLVDFDVVSASNLHRQLFYKTSDIGKAKAEVLTNYIKTITPFVTISFSVTALNKSNVFDQFKDGDIILDCTDRLPVKYLINDACVLKDKILVYGSLYKFDGYVATFNALDDHNKRTANLRDAFPEIPKGKVLSCSEVGTLNPIVGLIGLMQANEVIKLVAKIGKPLTNQLLIYNSLENTQLKIKLKASYKWHSEQKLSTATIFEKESYTDATCATQDDKLLISAESFKEKIASQKDDLFIILVNEKRNTDLAFTIDAHIPLSTFSPKDIAVNPLKTYVIVCRLGISSYAATLQLKTQYPKLSIFSLKGGIEGF